MTDEERDAALDEIRMINGKPMYYVLNDKHEAVAASLRQWSDMFESARDKRRVAQTVLPGQINVSTVFLGFDHGFTEDKPIIFETMAFDRTGHFPRTTYYKLQKSDSPRVAFRRGQRTMPELCQFRWSTWDEAIAGHVRVVMLMRRHGKAMHEARMAGNKHEFMRLYNTLWERMNNTLWERMNNTRDIDMQTITKLTMKQMLWVMSGGKVA